MNNELLRIAVRGVFKLACILSRFCWRSLPVRCAKMKIGHVDLIDVQSIPKNKNGRILS